MDNLKVGSYVRERDSRMTGTIIRFHMDWSYLHAVMRGRDGKEYDYNINHFSIVY